MSLDANALKLMLDTAVRGAQAQKLEVPDAHQNHYVLNGQYRTVAKDRPARVTEFTDLNDLVRYAIKRVSDPNLDLKSCFWVDKNGKRIIFEETTDGRSYDAAFLELSSTLAFVYLFQLSNGRQWAQPKDLAALLRTELHGCLANPKPIIDALRAVDFTQSQTVATKVDRTKESIDRSMRAEIVQNAGEIPETITLTLPVYEPIQKGMVREFAITCQILIDNQKGMVALVPLPGQVKAAERAAITQVSALLIEAIESHDEKVERMIEVYAGPGPKAVTDLLDK